MTITTVSVSGGMTVDSGRVEREAQSLLAGSYFLLVPKRFSYTYPQNALVQVLGRLPRVAHASVTRTSRTTLSVVLVEYTPSALWCSTQGVREDAEQDFGGECLYISEDGFAFAEAPLLEGAVLLRYVTENRSPVLGTPLAPPAYMQVTRAFVRAVLLAHGMHIYKITQTTEGDMRYQVQGGGELLVGADADMQE
ncbi:MAG: hypothetical protein U1A28_00760, partial [Patescibacteria group bacterium]|nr:hypothetical protein [Patescibacteria group bacterium]